MARVRPRTLCDIDGVVCNFVQMFLSAVEAATGIHADQKDIKTFYVEESLKLNDFQKKNVWDIVNSVGIAARMNPLPGAVEGVKALAKVSDLYFVTAPIDTSPTWDYDRRQWLIKHFGEELGKKVLFTASKEVVAGDIFIDDKPENLEEWKKAWPHGICVLWDQPYNQNGHVRLPRTSDWSAVVKVAKTMEFTPTYAGRRT
jgi:5'-nucleotidase